MLNSGRMARVHLDRVARAAAKLAADRLALRQAMLDAKDSGETYEDIGRAAGLTRQRAWQMINQGQPPPHT